MGESFNSSERAQEQLRDIIARDHNRAAVVLWSVANETPVEPARLVFLKSLVQQARTLDATRLVTAALNHLTHPSPNELALTDPLGEFLDVLGLNEYLGWYGKERPEDWRSHTVQVLPGDRPLIVSEFGGGAPFGNHGGSDARWTEEYQGANLYEHQISMVKRIPSLVGISPWALMDFHSPRRLLPGMQDYRNRKGLISDQGERKQAFYVLQEVLSETTRAIPKNRRFLRRSRESRPVGVFGDRSDQLRPNHLCNHDRLLNSFRSIG